jgi:hypothetical protein
MNIVWGELSEDYVDHKISVCIRLIDLSRHCKDNVFKELCNDYVHSVGEWNIVVIL